MKLLTIGYKIMGFLFVLNLFLFASAIITKNTLRVYKIVANEVRDL